ncbi:MAG: exodeoxyribonuclease VII small subunit [Clostridia bacterium]|nr:exodeoxyribonuclease VII small subunit [Oscillospiraceae bacterium]MBQ7032216.1 exodeoxyribonuclease VII small subunit [Clostridia bacterium]
MNFEQSMAELEKIVKTLEEGELPIEKSIEEFEKGIGLIKNLRAFLDTAQKQVDALLGEIDNEKTVD